MPMSLFPVIIFEDFILIVFMPRTRSLDEKSTESNVELKSMLTVNMYKPNGFKEFHESLVIV